MGDEVNPKFKLAQSQLVETGDIFPSLGCWQV